MNKAELVERSANMRALLDKFDKVQLEGCVSCQIYRDGACGKYGVVPADFVKQGCDEWEWCDVPF